MQSGVIPEKNLNFQDPSIESLNRLASHIRENSNNYPNHEIAIRVIECLMYIKLNKKFISFAIENKNNPAYQSHIYVDLPDDAKNKVLRAPNHLSFHIIQYNDPEIAFKDYSKLIDAIEYHTDFLLEDKKNCQRFVDKIRDSDVGCLDGRLDSALKYLVDPSIVSIHELFGRLQQSNKNISLVDLINYFDEYLNEYILDENGNEQKLTWTIIKSYCKNNLAYEESDLIFSKEESFKRIMNPQRAPNGDFFYVFPDEQSAKETLAIFKYLIGDQHPKLIKLGRVTHTRHHPKTPYRFRITPAQYEALQETYKSKVELLPSEKDYLIKSIRFDEKCFWDLFVNGMTHTEDKSQQPRAPLRQGSHKPYTVFADGVYEYSQRKSPYPADRLHEKKYLSRHQSTSLVTKEAQIPVFGHNTNRAQALAGVILDPKDALINRALIYDTGSVNRPWEFATKEGAEKYHAENANKKLFHDYDKFKNAIKQDTTKYNEVLARIRWNMTSSAIGIFSDTDESRYVAQVYASRLRNELKKLSGALPEKWDDTYEVPIYYYIPGSDKNYQRYTKEQQIEDIKKANLLLGNKAARENAFKNGLFACLLLADDPKTALAIEYNNQPIIIELIRLGLFHIADYMLDRSGQASLSDYLKQNNLLKKAEEQFTANDQCLIEAATSGRIDLVKKIISLAPKLINITDPTNSAPPLFFAAHQGHLEVVRALLEKGADVNKANIKGATPLYIAAHQGHLEVVRALLEKDADVNKADIKNGATPLYFAVQQGHLEVVRALLEKGADVNQADINGATPLCIAAEQGHREVVRALLENGADVNQESTNSVHPLLIAIANGHFEVVQALLEKGADVNKANTDGATPLYFAAQFGHLEVTRALLEKGADVNKANINGATPLYIAAHQGHLEVVRALLKKGADVNKANIHGTTPFLLAASCRHNSTSYTAIFNLLALTSLQKYKESRENDKRKYKSIFHLFSYDRDLKIKAAEYAIKVLNNESVVDVPLDLKKRYFAACNQGELGKICKAIGLVEAMIKQMNPSLVTPRK